MTNQETLLCWKCRAPLAKAQVRCRECGTPRNASPPQTPSSHKSGVLKTPATRSDEKALSIDDMFSAAEDIGEDDINQFVIATSEGLKAQSTSPPSPTRNTTPPPKAQAPKAPSSRTPEPKAPGPQSSSLSQRPESPVTEPTQTTSSPDESDARTPAPIPKRSNISGVTPAPTAQTAPRRRRGSESASNPTGSSLPPAILSATRLALKQPAPVLQKLDPKAATAKSRAAQKLLVKANKLIPKFESDDTKPAIDALRQTLLELGAAQHASVIPVIAKFLDDTRPSLPESASRALGSTRCPEAFEPLATQLMKAPVDSSGPLLSALGSLGDRRAVGILVAYGSEYPQYQMRVVDSLTDIGSDAVPRLIELAGSPETGQQLIVCIAMGKLKDARCLESLSNLLQSNLTTIRCYAAEALGELGDTKAIKILLAALKDPESNVRASAISALGKLPDERAVAPLIRCLKDSDRQVRLYAVNSIGLMGDKSAAIALSPLLDENDPELIAAACDALGRLGDPGAIDRLIQFLVIPENNEHTNLVLKVIDTVRRLQATAAVPALLELLRSPNADLRLKAVEAIGQCKQKSAAEEIEHVLASDASDEVRAAAAKALGELKDTESLNALVDALQDTLNVRVKAIIALGAIKNINAVPTLMPLLKDQAPELRYHATQALAELDHKKAVHQIELLVVDEVPMVSRGAFKALQKLGDDRPEKKIIAAAKKRTKLVKTAISSTTGSSFNFSEFFSDGLRGIVWPDDPSRRYVSIGIMSAMLLLPLIGIGLLFTLNPAETIVLRRQITSSGFTPDGKSIYITTAGGSLEKWESPKDDNYTSKVLVEPASLIDVIVLAGGEQIVASVNGIYEVNSSGKQSLGAVAGLSGISTSGDQTTFAAVDLKHNYYFFDTNKKPGAVLGAPFPNTSASCLGHDGKYVLFGNDKGKIRQLDPAGKVLGEFSVAGDVRSLAVSNDGSTIAVGLRSGQVALLDAATKTLKTTLVADNVNSLIHQVQFSPDGKLLAGRHAGVTVWELAGGTSKNVPVEECIKLKISPDGTQMISHVGDQSSLVFELVDLTTMEVVNQPAYRMY
jgi:HEAT repeat protein/WD40 repeat protein